MSNESPSYRIDWRPSRVQVMALIGLGVLAATSIWLSAIPLAAKLFLLPMPPAHAFWLARRELRKAPCLVNLGGDGAWPVLSCAGKAQRLAGVEVLVRGPLAFLSGRGEDGRLHRLCWWPDTLQAESRRALRLSSGKAISDSGPALATMSG